MSEQSATVAPLRHSSSVKRRPSTSKRRKRKDRRFSTPESSQSSSGPFGCCIYPSVSPEREFWSDVVFITPQGTPKLSSRHSTLNFNIVVNQAIAQRPNEIATPITAASVSPARDNVPVNNGQIVQAEIAPFRPNATDTETISSQVSTNSVTRTTACVTPVQVPAPLFNPGSNEPSITSDHWPSAPSDSPAVVTLANPSAGIPPTVTIPPFCDQRPTDGVNTQQVLTTSAQQVPSTTSAQQVLMASTQQVPVTCAQRVLNVSAAVMQCTCGAAIPPVETSQSPVAISQSHADMQTTETVSEANTPTAEHVHITPTQPGGPELMSTATNEVAMTTHQASTGSNESPMTGSVDYVTIESLMTTSAAQMTTNAISTTSNVMTPIAPSSTTCAEQPVTTDDPPQTTSPESIATNAQATSMDFSSEETNIPTDTASNAAECALSQTKEPEETGANSLAKSEPNASSCQREPAKSTLSELRGSQQEMLTASSDAMKKSTETQTDSREIVAPVNMSTPEKMAAEKTIPPVKTSLQDVIMSKKNTENQTLCQAVTVTSTGIPTVISTPASMQVSMPMSMSTPTQTTKPITVPTALGQIVLHSPPIMSTGVPGPIVSSQVSTGYSYKPLDSVNLPVSRYASFTCYNVRPNTVKLKPKYHCSGCKIPSTTVNTTISQTRTGSGPIYAKVSKTINKTAAQNIQPKQLSRQTTSSMPSSISAPYVGKQTKTSTQILPDNKKKPRRPAPGVPDSAYINIVSPDRAAVILDAGAKIPCTCNHKNSKGEMELNETIPPLPAKSSQKTKAELMQEVLENKPEVQNLVLVKRSQSQQQEVHTPKLLRRSQVSETLRRPVIKGQERQRLTKSIESLEDVALDLDIAYEFVRRKNYRTSFIGDVSPCEAAKQLIYEDNSFGDVQTVMKHTRKEPIYALPQPACFGEDTIQAVKRITEKYNTPQRWKLQAKSFESSLQRPTTVTMAGKGNSTSQQPHMVMSTPPSISTPYIREQARLGLFYRSYAAEICICDCLAELRQRSGPNEPWLPTHTGRPLLVFNTGEGRRRRQLELILADSNTALPLWSDFITYLSEFRPVDPTHASRPVHQLRLSSNLRTQVLIEYYNTKAAEDFYSRFLAITADPSDTLWMVSGDRSSLKKGATAKKKKISNKSVISQPLHFAHVTHMEAIRLPPEQESPLVASRVRSRSSETLN